MAQHNNNLSNNGMHFADALSTTDLRPAAKKPPPSLIVEAAASTSQPLTIEDLFSSGDQTTEVQSTIDSFQKNRAISMNAVNRNLDSATGIVFFSDSGAEQTGKSSSPEGQGAADFTKHVSDMTIARDINRFA